MGARSLVGGIRSKPIKDRLILETESGMYMFEPQKTIIQTSTVIPKIRGVATYKSAREIFKHIDALPPGPKISCTPLKVKGDLTDANGNNRLETLELWHHDPIECVAELLGNLFFRGIQQYAPLQVFRNKDGTNQEFGEMWTADWWWKTQVSEHNINRILRKAYFNDRNYNSHPCHCRIRQDPALDIQWGQTGLACIPYYWKY